MGTFKSIIKVFLKIIKYIIISILCLAITGIIYVKYAEKKEFKDLIKQGKVNSHLYDDELIILLCDIEEKYGSPSEQNMISREKAKEVINNVIDKKIDYEDWNSSYTDLYLFEDNNCFIFLECYSEIENNTGIKFFRIFDKNKNRFYMIIDGEAGFRYINSDFNFIYEKDISEYTSAFVDKATKEMVCGFEWITTSDNDAVHTIYNKNGDAEMYACYELPMLYWDASLKKVSRDDYLSLMDKYNEKIKQTYSFDFGHWGI